jgi:membrane protease YdiL (CAAX protease family)
MSSRGTRPEKLARMNARGCFLQTVVVLTLFTAARAVGLSGPTVVGMVALTAVLALVAARAGATAGNLGLRLADAGAGFMYGAAAAGIVLVVLVGAVVIPATQGFLLDARGEISGEQLLHEVLISILLLTAIPEEFAFRGVLLGSATALWGPWRGTLVTSALFGLWHVQPTLATMGDNPALSGAGSSTAGRAAVVVGAVAVTFLAGLLFAGLRLRSRSLLAPVLAHVATNGLGLVAAWVALHSTVLNHGT